MVDGEVVAFDENGRISFDAVQGANPQAPLTYYVFDVLWVNDYSVMQLSLIDRKRILKSMVPIKSVIKFSDHFKDGIALYEQAQKLQLEGIVAKNVDSIYQLGKRGNNWLKIPTSKRQEIS